MGANIETGFLLYGPPGCGKTLIAEAVANEAGSNFIHIRGLELLNKFDGQSDLAIKTLFTRARTCAPCILFFDELLVELEDADKIKGVYVIGATNRLALVDQALLKYGRFGKHIFVPLPGPDECGQILKARARGRPLDASVDLMTIGRGVACKNFSGADLSALVSVAAFVALEDKSASLDSSPGDTLWTINNSHFKRALEEISPSVSDEEINSMCVYPKP